MIQLQKKKQALKILQKTDIDLWIILVRETTMMRDPVMPLIADMYFSGLGAVIFDRNGTTTSITSFLEIESAKQMGLFDNTMYYDNQFEDSFSEYLGRNCKKKIALNFSKEDPSADGLTYGIYVRFMELLQKLDFEGEIVSSEPILSELKSVKVEEEIECIKKSIELAEKIFEDARHFIKVGVTEKDIFKFFQDKAREYGTHPSWELNQCPGVSVGANSPDGHCGPTDIRVEKGCLIGVDFGVVYNGYCSDLQRKYYVLNDGETDVPEHIKKAFYAVRDTIRVSKDFMREGVTGNEVDTMAREYLRQRGYEDWPHSLGHQVGLYVHDGGATLGKRKNKTNKLIDLPLKNGNVFAVEPSTRVAEGGVGPEEMVLITEAGTIFLSHPQDEIYVIEG